MVKMLRYVLLYLDLQKCLVFFLQFFCCFRVEIRNELANGCKLTNNQIRGWMLSEFRYLVLSGSTTLHRAHDRPELTAYNLMHGHEKIQDKKINQIRNF